MAEPALREPPTTRPRIVYSRDQLLALQSLAEGGPHQIPEDLKFLSNQNKKFRQRRRGCRAGVRVRERRRLQEARKEESAKPGPLTCITHQQPQHAPEAAAMPELTSQQAFQPCVMSLGGFEYSYSERNGVVIYYDPYSVGELLQQLRLQ